MWFSSWLRNPKPFAAGERGRTHGPARQRATFRPRLEALESRCLPSTLTVLNNHDSGPGSLRADIAAAASGDTIVFAPRLAGQTIKLTSGELAIAKSLTIQGPAAGHVAICGSHVSRVFEVDGATTNVTLRGLWIVDGTGYADSNPDAIGTNEWDYTGGGILNFGTLTVRGCTLSGNSAFYDGGGILNFGTLTVRESTLSGNSASGPGDGGGIENDGTLAVRESTLSGNSAGSGGGIFNGYLSTVTVSASTLSNNSAITAEGNGYGGGISNALGAVTVRDSTLSGNSAGDAVGFGYGGGIYTYSNGFGGLTVSGCTLSGNSATLYGGGIDDDFGDATVAYSTLSGNSAPRGGGIFNNGTLTVASSTLTRNAAIYGGAISNFAIGGSFHGSSMTIRDSILTGNSATLEGGGIYNTAFLTLEVRGSLFLGNSAGVSGGGIYNIGTATVRDCIVAGNSAGSKGGGIFNGASGTLTINHSVVWHNTAPLGRDLYNAGLVYVFDSIIGNRYDA